MYKTLPLVYSLSGLAGAGKTRLIKALAAIGAQTIDLEALAEHRGSVFGPVSSLLVTRESFHNALQKTWNETKQSAPVFLEREGPFIGSLDIPKPIYNQLVAAPAIELKADRYRRIQNILFDYRDLTGDRARYGIRQLKPILGEDLCRYCLELQERCWLPQLVDILLDYYDNSNLYSQPKYIACTIETSKGNPDEWVGKMPVDSLGRQDAKSVRVGEKITTSNSS